MKALLFVLLVSFTVLPVYSQVYCSNDLVKCTNGGTPSCSGAFAPIPNCSACGAGVANCYSEGLGVAGYTPCGFSGAFDIRCPAPASPPPTQPITPSPPLTPTCNTSALISACASQGLTPNLSTCDCNPAAALPTTPTYTCDPGYTSCPDNMTKGICCANGCCPSDPTKCKCSNNNQCYPDCSVQPPSLPSGPTNNSSSSSSSSTGGNFSVTPSSVNVSVNSIPTGITQLVVPVVVDTSIINLTQPTSNVAGAIVLADGNSKAVGIISNSSNLPANLVINVPIVPIMIGTSPFSTGEIVDMLGGSKIFAAVASTNVSSVTVSQGSVSSPPSNSFSNPTLSISGSDTINISAGLKRYVLDLAIASSNFIKNSSCSILLTTAGLGIRIKPNIFSLGSSSDSKLVKATIPISKKLKRINSLIFQVNCDNGTKTEKIVLVK